MATVQSAPPAGWEAAWAKGVNSRGGQAAVYPDTKNARYASGSPLKVQPAGTPRPAGYNVGDLAEAYVVNGVRVFVPPPAQITSWYRLQLAQQGSDLKALATVEAIESAAKTVAAAPKKIVDQVLDLPPWLIPAIVGVGALLLISQLSHVIPSRRS